MRRSRQVERWKVQNQERFIGSRSDGMDAIVVVTKTGLRQRRSQFYLPVRVRYVFCVRLVLQP